ncbi:fucolectin-4-like [Patiria miniata]|uniref:Fucolectin tachylectin-4 pentraxin-1 domain-containing protein n=1 Tax=Patiria miniata TaxID=46514 RepID=A0A914A777_PATMI|nr:fucolectin-4-like [Patiria miniata]
MMFRDHLGTFLVVFVAFSLKEGLSLDLRGPGITTSQSSTAQDAEASNAVDRDTGTLAHTGYATPEQRTNPWWKVDLGAVYCLRKITLVNRNRLG